jgi:hypothetical protein
MPATNRQIQQTKTAMPITKAVMPDLFVSLFSVICFSGDKSLQMIP